MNSLSIKVDAPLRERLDQVGDQTRLHVEIVPLQSRWRGLLGQLRAAPGAGVEYNVIDQTSISATLPKWLIEAIAVRRDVVAVRLQGDGE